LLALTTLTFLKKIQLEGIVTIVMGIVFAVLFPGSPVAPKSMCGICIFTEQDKAILRARMELSQGAEDADHKKKVTFKDIWFTVRCESPLLQAERTDGLP
jgi:hypothetical protein